MPNYRREYFGIKWFFTVVSHDRAPVFASEAARSCLRSAIEDCRKRHPFVVDAWVLLPDHIHCIWSPDKTDSDFSRRWSIIRGVSHRNFGTELAASHPSGRSGFGNTESVTNGTMKTM